MTGNTAFILHRRMFVHEWTLFVCVTLDAGRVCACRKSCLFQFETTVRIVTVAALHRAFQHFVVGGQIKLVLDFRVAAQAKLWFIHLQQLHACETGLLRIGSRNEDIRARQVSSRFH